MASLPYCDLVRRLASASNDELRVIDKVLARLEVGRERYGLLDLAKPRDWRRERFEERLDALVYDVCEELVLEDAGHAKAQSLIVGPGEGTVTLVGVGTIETGWIKAGGEDG